METSSLQDRMFRFLFSLCVIHARDSTSKHLHDGGKGEYLKLSILKSVLSELN